MQCVMSATKSVDSFNRRLCIKYKQKELGRLTDTTNESAKVVGRDQNLLSKDDLEKTEVAQPQKLCSDMRQ